MDLLKINPQNLQFHVKKVNFSHNIKDILF